MFKNFLILFLIFPVFVFSQNLQIGASAGIGTTTNGGVEAEKTDLKINSLFLFTNLEEDTLFQFRGGKIKTRKEKEPVQSDLNYYGITVSYLFDTAFGNTGFFGGITYYDGKREKMVLKDDEFLKIEEEIGKIGAMAGYELLIPLTRKFNGYMEIELHYIPVKDEFFTLNLQGGILIRF